MKQLFFILTICCLFLTGQDYLFGRDGLPVQVEESYLSGSNEVSSLQLHISNLNLLPPASMDLIRVSKPAFNLQEQIIKSVNRFFQSFQLKKQSIQYKISETLLIRQTVNYFSLRNRYGHWVYVLRKIVI